MLTGTEGSQDNGSLHIFIDVLDKFRFNFLEDIKYAKVRCPRAVPSRCNLNELISWHKNIKNQEMAIKKILSNKYYEPKELNWIYPIESSEQTSMLGFGWSANSEIVFVSKGFRWRRCLLNQSCRIAAPENFKSIRWSMATKSVCIVSIWGKGVNFNSILLCGHGMR